MHDRLPRHIGFIPDGNRRWAKARGLLPESGYGFGIEPGVALFEACRRRGIQEATVYGFTRENVRRPAAQVAAFGQACVVWAESVAAAGAAVQVVGDAAGRAFPAGLRPFLRRTSGDMRVNLLANYGFSWDLAGLGEEGRLRSEAIPRLDLIVRWGGGRRLSGFLPAQSAYADLFVVKALWPDFSPNHLDAALAWYSRQDRTLGG